eukprot:6186447-Pleurochrysis_carterae.AAC.2
MVQLQGAHAGFQAHTLVELATAAGASSSPSNRNVAATAAASQSMLVACGLSEREAKNALFRGRKGGGSSVTQPAALLQLLLAVDSLHLLPGQVRNHSLLSRGPECLHIHYTALASAAKETAPASRPLPHFNPLVCPPIKQRIFRPASHPPSTRLHSATSCRFSSEHHATDSARRFKLQRSAVPVHRSMMHSLLSSASVRR